MKHRFDKTAVANAVAYGCAMLTALEISVWLSPYAKIADSYRYLQQFTYTLTVILSFITANKIKKLIPETLRRAVADSFLYAARRLASGISRISKRILKILGMNLDRYKKQKDEKSFVFDVSEMGIFKRLSSFKSGVKWKDLTDNSEKIRFIYIKYMVKWIKGGYKTEPCLTPKEVRARLELDEGANGYELFDMYNGARYSGGSVRISDEQVDRALDAVSELSVKKK